MERDVIVVTGAARGMGHATAQRLLHPDSTMLLVDLDGAALARVRDELAEDAPGSEWVTTSVVDVTDPDAVARLAGEVAELGRLRTLAHAAGISPTMARWWPILHVDLVGTALVLQALLPLAGPGTVAVCWASSAAHGGPIAAGDPEIDAVLDEPLAPDFRERMEALVGESWADEAGSGAAYSWAKRGVVRLVRNQAPAWGERGARIVSISPGIINTPMSRQEFEQQPMMKVMLDNTPIPRFGAPSEIVEVVAFLASPSASYITGTDILVDGGVTAAIGSMLGTG